GDLDIGERLALRQAGHLRYLDTQHWNRTHSSDTLYAVSLDLRKFYPSVRTAAIVKSFDLYVEGFSNQTLLRQLVHQMLEFRVETAGVTDETKSHVDPPVESGAFDGIPTGLFVGGFLANAAMLPIDLEVDALLSERRDIAQFRFVDDHEVLAYDFRALLNWLKDYEKLLARHNIGATIESEKYIPPKLTEILNPKSSETDEHRAK